MDVSAFAGGNVEQFSAFWPKVLYAAHLLSGVCFSTPAPAETEGFKHSSGHILPCQSRPHKVSCYGDGLKSFTSRGDRFAPDPSSLSAGGSLHTVIGILYGKKVGNRLKLVQAPKSL